MGVEKKTAAKETAKNGSRSATPMWLRAPDIEQRELARAERDYFKERTHLTLEGLYLPEPSGMKNLAGAFAIWYAKTTPPQAGEPKKLVRLRARPDPPWHPGIVAALYNYIERTETKATTEAWPRHRRESRERMIRAAKALRAMLDDLRVAVRLRDRLGVRNPKLGLLHALPGFLVAEANGWREVPAAEDDFGDSDWRDLLVALRAVRYPPAKPKDRLSPRLIAAVIVGCGLREDRAGTLPGNIEKILQRLESPDPPPP